MRSFICIALAVILTGCGTPSGAPIRIDWLGKNYAADYKSYDPCIKCGEGWGMPIQQDFDAQIRYARGERW